MNNSQIIDVLRKARELLSKGWNKRWYALNAAGLATSIHSEYVCSFCFEGAIERAIGQGPRMDDVVSVYNALKPNLPPSPYGHNVVVAFNDSQDTVEPVLAVIDKTIADLQGAQ